MSAEANFNDYYITDEGKIYTIEKVYHDDLAYHTVYQAGEEGSAENLVKLLKQVFEEGKKYRSDEIRGLISR